MRNRPVSSSSYFFFFLALGFLGCQSMSTMQSAHPLKEGHASLFVAGGYQSMAIKNPARADAMNDPGGKELEDAIESIKAPLLEVGVSYGLFKDFNIGAKVTVPGGYTGEAKYTLNNRENYALAIGGSIGYVGIESEDSLGKSKMTLMDFSIPLLYSYDLSDWSAITLAPRYILRSVSSTTTWEDPAVENSSSSDTASLIGMSVGINLAWFIAEAAYVTSPSQADVGIYQVLVGVWTGWDDLDKPGARSDIPEPKKKKTKSKKKI